MSTVLSMANSRAAGIRLVSKGRQAEREERRRE
jgi:hypothetical protein